MKNPFNNYFTASLCRKGILGGALLLDNKKITYFTNKVTVAPRYRHLEIPLSRITEIKCCRVLGFPAVTVRLDNAEVYKFIVFRRKGFLKRLREVRE